jgi:hypothetical protein
LKELVSNAHDAGAGLVTINTGYPIFNKIVVTDDGDGITSDKFTHLVQNIGLSDKIAGDTVSFRHGKLKRTIVGHYGIGLLAVGQLAAKMTITSKTRDTDGGFTAKLDFDQFERIQSNDRVRSRVKDEQEIEKAGDPAEADGKFRIGRCLLSSIRYPAREREKGFTRIELDEIRQEVVHKLSGGVRNLNPDAKKKQAYSASYSDLLRLLRKNEGEANQGLYPYEKLIWELGVYCPLQYPKIGPFVEKGQLHKIAELASESDFSLIVDGMRVRKPFEKDFFESEEYPPEKIFAWLDEPYTEDPGGPHASCYFIYKRRIRPKALQGLLVREGGVAIGMYDTTFLEYPFNEGQKFSQLTGEIFAKGLSGALNIDRNSFNQTDDRYLKLCSWIHAKLNSKVFPSIKKLQKSPASERRQENLAALERVLEAFALSKRRKVGIGRRKLGKNAPLFKAADGKIIINIDHREGSGSSAKQGTVTLAGALILAEMVTPEQIEEVLEAIRDLKRETEK